ncbi:hypothetical protein [Bradyrhizobium sp.]|uniref:hypothetical protein n=1 Tax=Bradyrhizobium sp. TaxID=376 RepID=UPI002D2C412A|nr:hypothetical protein [Bradyrhizobium sp.]HZR77280.1 hypothetical protein [Bradyrhizobium sp.]
MDLARVTRARAVAAALAMAVFSPALSSSRAHAAELAYDPPIGSRWIVETEIRSEETRPEGSTTSLVRTRAELTVEAKTADGFRISWVQRGSMVEGNARSVALRRAYANVPENIVIRASTDASGKPLRIDNLDEARAAMRRSADTLAAQFAERPAARALFDQLMSELTEADAENAASVYIDAMVSLAAAQNAGMKPGEFRWTSKPAQNPLGGDALMANERFELTDVDSAGRLTFVSATSVDPVAMSDFMQSFAKSLLAASGDSVTPARVDLLVKSMLFSFDKRAEFQVEDGMTRKVAEKSTTVFRSMEQNLTQSEARTIAVSRAP